MEVVFCSLFNFFPPRPQKDQRGDRQAPQQGRGVGQQLGQGPHRAAEEEEVGHRPQEEGGRHVDAQLPAPHGDGVAEEPGGDRHPEGEVQDRPHQGPPHPEAEEAEDKK